MIQNKPALPQEDTQIAGSMATAMTSFSPAGPEPSSWWTQGNTMRFSISPEAQRVLVKYMPALAASEAVLEDIRIRLECIFAGYRGARLGALATIMVYLQKQGPSIDLQFHGSRCSVLSAESGYYQVKDVESPALMAIADLAIQSVVHACLMGIARQILDLDQQVDLSHYPHVLRVARDPNHEPLQCYLVKDRESGAVVGMVRTVQSIHGAQALIQGHFNDPHRYELIEPPEDDKDLVVIFSPGAS